ncbi:hypothetical protein OPIT5_10870 [Opitutaceae bacterium TAV5]|nr:hypothetical protein OPIT5_10870 [Opitutaceae bacterium TAV5]
MLALHGRCPKKTKKISVTSSRPMTVDEIVAATIQDIKSMTKED